VLDLLRGAEAVSGCFERALQRIKVEQASALLRGQGPIDDGELPSLFAPLAGASRIAIAVSGGCDSLALLDCIDRWRRQQPKPPTVLVLTVDHGLRQSSASDARRVVATARKRGLKAEVLRWTGEKPKGDIEAAARAARYRLLLGATRAAKASHLLLAHQATTRPRRLLPGCAGIGVFGLPPCGRRSRRQRDDLQAVSRHRASEASGNDRGCRA
jgi:tRNA(Ile)-lysidine synthase